MEFAIRMLNHALEESDARLRRFAAELESNAASAFEWSASAFEAAATRRVFLDIKRRLSGSALAAVREYVQAEVNSTAKRGSRSTSQAANLMSDELMSAWARALDILHDTEVAK